MTGTAAAAGVRGIEHVGLTVPDLDEAVRFFCAVLGCRHVFDGGRFSDADLLARQLGVPGARAMRYAFLRCGHGPNLELFEYDVPGQRRIPPGNGDVGGHHLAFYVDDFDSALRHVEEHGLTMLGEPQLIEDGPAAGSRWIYVLAPWGLQLELCSYPNGKGPDASPARGLWHPAHPER